MILIPEVMVWQQRSVELRTLKLIRKELKKEGMAVILEANGSVCRNYFHLFVQKAWNLQLRKRQPLLANSFWCVRCCDSSQMAWEMRIRVGKPAGVGRKGLLLNPKTFLTHSLGRFALFSEIPAGICWGWSGGRGGDLSRREGGTEYPQVGRSCSLCPHLRDGCGTSKAAFLEFVGIWTLDFSMF